MFTGLIDHSGTIESYTSTPGGFRLKISTKWHDIAEGESIAINGVCLTAVDQGAGFFYVDVSPATIAVTTFGSLSIGSRVNLERSLRVGDKLGGHFVTGHVDEIAEVIEITSQGEFCLMAFQSRGDASRFIIPKGSVAVNGVSLTINHISESAFSVMLIPHTLELTNLSDLQLGSMVNIEYDMLAKCVANSVRQLSIGAFNG